MDGVSSDFSEPNESSERSNGGSEPNESSERSMANSSERSISESELNTTFTQWKKNPSYVRDGLEQLIDNTIALLLYPRTDIDPNLLWCITSKQTDYIRFTPFIHHSFFEKIATLLQSWPLRITDMSDRLIDPTICQLIQLASNNILVAKAAFELGFLSPTLIENYDVFRQRSGEYRSTSLYDSLLRGNNELIIEYIVGRVYPTYSRVFVYYNMLGSIPHLSKWINFNDILIIDNYQYAFPLATYLKRHAVSLFGYFYGDGKLDARERIEGSSPAEIYFRKFPHVCLEMTGILITHILVALQTLPLSKETYHEMVAGQPGLSNLERYQLDSIFDRDSQN